MHVCVRIAVSESELEAIVKAGQTLMLPPEVRTPLHTYLRIYVATYVRTHILEMLVRIDTYEQSHKYTNKSYLGNHRSVVLLFYPILREYNYF